MTYEVVIVGAGTGGTLLARELARKDVDVKIFEKESFDNLGHDWSDAVEKDPLEKAGFELPQLKDGEWSGTLVKDGDGGIFEPHPIRKLKIFSPNLENIKEINFDVIITDRRRLAQKLVQQAEEAGTEVKFRHEGLELVFEEKGKNRPDGVEVQGVKVKNLETGDVEEVSADIVVESSGFDATLRTTLPEYTGIAEPFSESDFAMVQREVRARYPKKAKEDPIPDQYRYGYHSGYQWSHIHTEEKIDVGAGVKHTANTPDPGEIIEKFTSKHPSIKPEKIRGGRSLCIVGPPLTNFVVPGFMVLGDAASTSIPTTGCGVGSALMAGLWGSKVLEKSANEEKNDMNCLWKFNRKFYSEKSRGPNLAALSGTQTMLQSLDHDELNFLYEKDLLNGEILENSINGAFETGNISQTLKGLAKGITRPNLLFRLAQILFLGYLIKNHYKNYPEKWSYSKYSEWKEKAISLHQTAETV